GVATSSLRVTVDNVAPVIDYFSALSPVIEGGTLSVVGTFHDAGAQDTHTIVINWGGGTIDQPAEGTTTITTAGPNPVGTSLVTDGKGNWSFTASHAYLDDNPTATQSDNYSITANITDDDGGSVGQSVDVMVNNIPPTLTSLSGGVSATLTAPVPN